MSPPTLVASILMLATGLLPAAVMLGMLSEESDRSLIQQPPESFTAEMSGALSAERCAETAVAEVTPETAWIFRC